MALLPKRLNLRRSVRNWIIFTILSFLAVMLIKNLSTVQSSYSIEPELQLQRFGLVSEEGIIEANKIEKIDKKRQLQNSKSNSNSNKKLEPNKKSENLERFNKAKERNRKNIEKNMNNLISEKDLDQYRNKAKLKDDNSNLKSLNLLNNAKIDEFIDSGEPASILEKMTGRARKIFQRRVNLRKQERGIN